MSSNVATPRVKERKGVHTPHRGFAPLRDTFKARTLLFTIAWIAFVTYAVIVMMNGR